MLSKSSKNKKRIKKALVVKNGLIIIFLKKKKQWVQIWRLKPLNQICIMYRVTHKGWDEYGFFCHIDGPLHIVFCHIDGPLHIHPNLLLPKSSRLSLKSHMWVTLYVIKVRN